MSGLKKCPNCLYDFDETKDIRDGKYHCPKCGVSFGFGNEASDEINEGYRKLGNLRFEDAGDIAEKLLEKDRRNAEAWFLKVLAANRVCYCDNDNKELWRYDKIPTLNDVQFSNIRTSEYAVNALKYAQTEEQKKRFNEVFDYLEKVRVKASEIIESHAYDCDIFISVKVSAIDETTLKPKMDGEGNVLKTADYNYARELYDGIREKYPDCKVFLSEQKKAELVAKEYEPIIFAALRSAKVMILVGGSNFNIEWPWVKNEWKRYLYWKDNLNDGKERNFVFMVRSPRVVLPPELKPLQSINAADFTATGNLYGFLDDALAKGESKKLKGKAFEDDVPEVFGSATVSEISKKALNKYVPVKKNTTVDRKINAVVRELEDSADESDSVARKRKRVNCFNDLRAICETEHNPHRAQLYLLLENSNSVNFCDFFFDTSASSEARKKFFDIADEEEALFVIQDVVLKLKSKNWGDCDISVAQRAFEDAVAPYFHEINGEDLRELSENMFLRVSKELSAMCGKKTVNTETVDKVFGYAHCYLLLRQYLSANSSKKYIEDRKALLIELTGIASDALAPKVAELCAEISKVEKGNAYSLWYGIESKLFKTIESPMSLFSAYNSRDDKERYTKFSEMLKSCTGVVVHNKETIDVFDKLFHVPEDSADSYMFDKKTFLLFFLELIIHDKLTYKGVGGVLEPSRGDKNGELSGYDLFLKYIDYDLGEKTSLQNASFYFKRTNDGIFVPADSVDYGDESVLEPTISVSALKKNRKPVDVMLSYFAVNLQQLRFFDGAISMYEYYLAQQNRELVGEDCILIKFYMALCRNKCIDIKEQKSLPSRIDVHEIKYDINELIDYYNSDAGKRDSLMQLLKTVSDFAFTQNAFADEAKQIKSKIDSLPAYNMANYDRYASVASEVHKILDELNAKMKNDKSLFSQEIFKRLNGFKEIGKLDSQVAALQRMVLVRDRIFAGNYKGQTAWKRFCGSTDYKLEEFEKDISFLRQNKAFFGDSLLNLDDELKYLQQKCKKKEILDKRAYEEEVRQAKERERALKSAKVVGKTFLVLLMLASKIVVGYYTYHIFKASELFDKEYFVFVVCAIFDFVSQVILSWIDDDSALFKFQNITSLVYVPIAAITSFLFIAGIFLAGCNSCLSCSWNEMGDLKGVLQYLAIALPSVAVSAFSIYKIASR